jgi:predicted transcriptional regulator
MACIDSSGQLSESGRRILAALSAPNTLEEIAKQTGLPLFRIRSGAREMLQAGLVEEKESVYVATAAGRSAVESPP